MESYLKRRQSIKVEIDQTTDSKKLISLQIQASLIKLLINSVYGYCLLDESSNKYRTYRIIQTNNYKKSLNKYKPYAECILNSNYVIAECLSESKINGFDTKRMLPEYGTLILQSSKVILLKSLYFILSHLCPTKIQLLYCDTDSIHLAMSEKTLR